MPVYEEKIKDKNGKMVPKLVDGKKRYFIKVFIKDEFGKGKQITRRNKQWLGNKGKLQAQQEELRIKNKMIITNETISINTLSEKFLIFKQKQIKFSSYIKYKNDISKYIIPYFNQVKVKNITSNNILEWQNQLNKTSLSTKSKRHIFTVFSSILKYGCVYFEIEKNVMNQIENFKETQVKKEMNFLTEQEFKNFIKFEENELYKKFFILLFYTGMRRGEALALTWNDIDFEKNEITIDKTYNPKFEKIGQAQGTPKTKKSNRKIKMLNMVQNLFENKNSQSRIFYEIKATTLQRKCDKNCISAGITKKIRIHDFRHSFASMCIEKEVPISIISEYLGHENISITLEIYSHLYPNAQDKLLSKLN